MPKTKILTLKQRRFIKELTKTLSPTDAAVIAYNCKNRNSASSIASENLIKLKISMPDLLDKMGLSLEEDISDLKRLRKAQKVIGYLHQYKKNKDGQIEKAAPNEAVSNEFVDVDDCPTQLKALELTLKLKGKLKEKVEHSGEIKGQKTVNINILKLNEKSEQELIDVFRGSIPQESKR